MIDILIVITIFSYMEHHSWKSGINIKLYKSYINTLLSFKNFWVAVVAIFFFEITQYNADTHNGRTLTPYKYTYANPTPTNIPYICHTFSQLLCMCITITQQYIKDTRSTNPENLSPNPYSPKPKVFCRVSTIKSEILNFIWET